MFRVVRTAEILSFHPSLPACTSQAVFVYPPNIHLPAARVFPSSCPAFSCLSDFLAVTVSPVAGEILASSPHTDRSLTPPVISAGSLMGQTTALPELGSQTRVHAGAGLAWVLLQRASGLRLPPLATSPVFIAGFNKAAGFAEKHFSWRCFPSRVGGWQRLAKSGDLSLVCLLWPGREACSEMLSSACPAGCTQSLVSRRTNLSPCHGDTCACACGCTEAFHKGCKCTQLTASLESTCCFPPQSQLLSSARAIRCTL